MSGEWRWEDEAVKSVKNFGTGTVRERAWEIVKQQRAKGHMISKDAAEDMVRRLGRRGRISPSISEHGDG